MTSIRDRIIAAAGVGGQSGRVRRKEMGPFLETGYGALVVVVVVVVQRDGKIGGAGLARRTGAR